MQFQNLVELAPDGIVVVSPEFQIHFANAKARSLLGDMLGSQDLLSHFIPADQVKLRTLAGELLARAIESVSTTASLHPKEPGPIQVGISARIVDWNSQTALYLTFHDQGEFLHMDAQFLRAQRMQTLGTLAGSIAHDLNNVLTPVSMALGIVQGKVHDAMANFAIDAAMKSVQRGSELVGQVLTFARGDDSSGEGVSLRRAMRELEKILVETMPPHINLLVESKDVTARASSTQIHQILMNLCVNARDAMPAGGVLVIRGSEVVHDEASAHPGRWACMEVRDTGQGMTAEILKHIWDPFFSTKAAGKGTGLGLRTVAQIVKDLGGFATVESEVGKGSIFYIHLPVAELETQPETTPQSAHPSGSGQTILVCDDDAAVLEMLATTLECHGYKVEQAADGMEALSLHSLCQTSIDCVLTDLVMPFVDGFKLAETVRKLTPSTPVILMTGNNSPEVFTTAEDLELPLLKKPFSTGDLLNQIATALQMKK